MILMCCLCTTKSYSNIIFDLDSTLLLIRSQLPLFCSKYFVIATRFRETAQCEAVLPSASGSISGLIFSNADTATKSVALNEIV